MHHTGPGHYPVQCPAVAVIIFTVVTMQCGDVEMAKPQLLVTAHLLLNIQAHGVGGAQAEDGRLSTVSTLLAAGYMIQSPHSCSVETVSSSAMLQLN